MYQITGFDRNRIIKNGKVLYTSECIYCHAKCKDVVLEKCQEWERGHLTYCHQ